MNPFEAVRVERHRLKRRRKNRHRVNRRTNVVMKSGERQLRGAHAAADHGLGLENRGADARAGKRDGGG
jgi:hypothetical protein